MTMKKRGIVLLLAMLANSITVFGQSISLTELEIPFYEAKGEAAFYIKK